MGIFTIFLIILLAIDSIFALVVAYKEKWKLLAIAVVIGGLLDLLIIKLNG